MIVSFVEAGLDPESFWHLTPREIALRIDGAVRRMKHEHRGSLVLAWHVAALSRAKKLPKLDALLKEKPANAGRRQSAEEMIAIAMSWDRAINRKK